MKTDGHKHKRYIQRTVGRWISSRLIRRCSAQLFWAEANGCAPCYEMEFVQALEKDMISGVLFADLSIDLAVVNDKRKLIRL